MMESSVSYLKSYLCSFGVSNIVSISSSSSELSDGGSLIHLSRSSLKKKKIKKQQELIS